MGHPNVSHESGRIQAVLPSLEVVASIGRQATGEPGRLIQPEHMPDGKPMTITEGRVLFLASLGGTVFQLADLLGEDRQTVEDTRDSLIGKFDARNTANAVHKAILRRVLPVDTPERIRRPADIGYGRRDLRILEMVREGRSNAEIAERLGRSKSVIVRTNRALFRRMAASGRTHSVRRTYEIGLERLPAIGDGGSR